MAERRSSVFTNEWRRCLGEHYKYVVKAQDTATEATLTPIMQRVGFTEAELSGLYRAATQRAEDLPDDFVPDLAKALPAADAVSNTAEASFQVHPAECNCPACMDEVLEQGHDDDGQPLPAAEHEEEASKPQQRSLF